MNILAIIDEEHSRSYTFMFLFGAIAFLGLGILVAKWTTPPKQLPKNESKTPPVLHSGINDLYEEPKCLLDSPIKGFALIGAIVVGGYIIFWLLGRLIMRLTS